VDHSLALDSEGHLWAWGDNQSGTLGDGTTLRSTVPKRIGGNQRFTAIKAGAFHSLAIRTDGTLWAWGYNKFGALGIGHTSEQELTPQRSTMNRVVLTAGGHYHTIAAGSGPE
jgi:alpha-tubulin suppressor-like RCC1 family protein